MQNRLDFKELGLRNFLSYGPKEQTVRLDGDFITCVLGENRDTGGEDSRNGTGKSAFVIDALCYVLFGKVIRGISNQKLINKMSEKGQMVVWVRFTKDDKDYHIERTERPGKLLFLCKPSDNEEDFKTKDGRKLKFDVSRGKTETTNQIIEILGFDITLFEYLVANSSESIEFFKLKESDQRAVAEELFGFTIMSIKADGLKKERLLRNKELVQAESAAEATKQANDRIAGQIKELELRSDTWDRKRESTIGELEEAIALLKNVDAEAEITILKEIDTLSASVKDVSSKVRELESEKREHDSAKRQQERDAKLAVSDMEQAQETIDALEKSECPTCHQHWEADPKLREETSAILAGAEIRGSDALIECERLDVIIKEHANSLQEAVDKRDAIKDSLRELEEVELTYDNIEDAASADATLTSLKDQLTNESETENPHIDSITGLRGDALKEVNDSDVQEMRLLIKHYNYLIELLTKKDSFLRQRIIDRWLPILNRRLAYWLEVLELPHIVVFQPDLSISIVNYHEEFDYGNLSKGQRARLRVALNFSFQDVFEFMHYPINLLAVDELLDSGICPRGAENAVKALREICQKKDKRVFLVTHRDDIAARVDDVIKVVLENNQSKITHMT
jgi:DNA repair exonuclease SbcCD ATPase subunit